MLVKEPKYRKALNAKQIKLLRIIYKFRFVSVPLVADFLKKDKSSIYENLYVLEKQGLIAKRYDKTYKLRGRPASYHLASDGIKLLRTHPDTKDLVTESVLKNYYKNKNISEEHIDYCLNVIAIFLAISKQTSKAFSIYSKSEQTPIEALPRPLPDLYLERQQKKQGKQFNYMLDIFEPGIPTWLITRRLRHYQNHADEVSFNYPNILLVASNDSTEKRMQDIIEGMLDDFDLYTITQERLLNPDNSNKLKLWKSPFEEELVGL